MQSYKMTTKIIILRKPVQNELCSVKRGLRVLGKKTPILLRIHSPAWLTQAKNRCIPLALFKLFSHITIIETMDSGDRGSIVREGIGKNIESMSLLKTLLEKEKMSNFSFTHCFLLFWTAFCHFRGI